MTTFFRYSGNKIPHINVINFAISQYNNDIYCEPFAGSGAVLFNLKKTFKKYVINDIDKNIYMMYKTFKEITWETYYEEVQYVIKTFGRFDLDGRYLPETERAKTKDNYYKFRDHFNKHWWGTGTQKEGIYLHFLANSCINSFLRFGPNGMNQGFGNRFYTLKKNNFDAVKARLRDTIILNTSYEDLFDNYPDALFFLDPPYFSQESSYSAFDENDIKKFIKNLPKDYLYTDIINDYNKDLHKNFLQNMRNTAPKSLKQTRGNLEYLFSSKDINIRSEKLDEW